MQHETPVMCFATTRRNPSKVACGRSDGGITTWDIEDRSIVNEIEPDSERYFTILHNE